MRIFILGEELQLVVYNNASAFKISKLIVGSIQKNIVDRKVTLHAGLTNTTYEQYLWNDTQTRLTLASDLRAKTMSNLQS